MLVDHGHSNTIGSSSRTVVVGYIIYSAQRNLRYVVRSKYQDIGLIGRRLM